MPRKKMILGACLGECIHVAGIMSFLQIANRNDYKTRFIGVASSIDRILDCIHKHDPEIVAISYRLSPETAEKWLDRLSKAAKEHDLTDGRTFIFGGTEPVAKIARNLGLFGAVFGGNATATDVNDYLQGKMPKVKNENDEDFYASTLLSRIAFNYPMPVIRHHFGLPSFDETAKGIEKIAKAEVLDIISLGIDQDAQANFFHPERQDESRIGAGGVPVREKDQFRTLYYASRRGNYPLMRCYAGTDDLIELAKVYLDTINNCFAAIPIFWFNKVDGRGPMTLRESIKVHMETIKWHGDNYIPVEVNDPHHWTLRGAHDPIYVATSYLSAYIAKKMGVRDYIMQLMFNTPPGVSFKMDLAKMLASIELAEELQDENFTIHRETRTGLLSYPPDQDMAKGQLSSSVMLQMSVKPEIVHVVGYCEADHAATADEVIESCRIAGKVIENAVNGMPDMTLDPDVQQRKEALRDKAILIINAIRELGEGHSDDPLLDPDSLANAVRIGLLDAPQIIPSDDTMGKIKTRIANGACYAVDENDNIILETERLEKILRESGLNSTNSVSHVLSVG